MGYFSNKIAIVTGGASGIGQMLCEELAARGAVVTVADLNFDGAQRVASKIVESGGRARATSLDVANADAVRELINAVATENHRLDFIFNNAGIGVGGEVRDLTPEHWRRIVEINLFGVISGTCAAYSLMVKQGFGHIVNTASLAGLISSPTMTPYTATKFAVVGLSTALRSEAEALGVRVSAVCPGFIQTGIFDAGTFVGSNKEAFLSQIPFKLMDARTAARKILRGVERNRGIIVFPFYARFLWWLGRIHPGLLSPLSKKTVSDFRRSRTTPPAKD
jgi:NAD(P)-dependent dehydrogenase (short-subunit alcohol dehydrogenase family)